MVTIYAPTVAPLPKDAVVVKPENGEEDLTIPSKADEAVSKAVKLILRAATDLMRAADLAEDGTPVDGFINSAIRLRDLATSLNPSKPDWPTAGAAIYCIKSKKRLN